MSTIGPGENGDYHTAPHFRGRYRDRYRNRGGGRDREAKRRTDAKSDCDPDTDPDQYYANRTDGKLGMIVYAIIIGMLKMTLLPLLWVLFAFPLADYQIRTVAVLPIDSYPAKVTLGGVTIAVDPFSTDEKSFTAFDVKDMNSRGYFPLHVVIRNASRDYLSLKTRNIMLLTESGRQLYTTPATIVVEDVVKEGAAFEIPKTKKSNNGATPANTGSPLADFTGKELINRILEPDSISDGFLFFFTDQAKQNLFAGSKLVIPELLNEGTQKLLGSVHHSRGSRDCSQPGEIDSRIALP